LQVGFGLFEFFVDVLSAANERLTDMLVRGADWGKTDPVGVVESQKKIGDYVR